MQQPSAQGIASLYRGNPQPLQQSIQKDQQAKPGLPPDLQKMLALQIVTNEEDSAAAQKAMEQLQQMSGGQGGKPPTVMASLQQQAQQKLQARAQQARQQAEQRGLPAGLMGVQGEPPQPAMQPEAQGIDQSDRVAFAGARGGIVAFTEGGDTMGTPSFEQQELASQASDQAIAERQKAKLIAELEQKLAFLINADSPKATEVRAQLEKVKTTGSLGSAPAPSTAPASPRMTSPQPTNQTYTRKSGPATSIVDLKTLNEQKQRQQAPRPAPAPAPAPAPVAAPTPVEPTAAEKVLNARVAADPAAQKLARQTEMDTELGRPDTAQHDRLIAELEKRKQSLAPKQGFEGLMEYLGQVSANSQPGRGSFASGAAGARGMDKLNRERQLEQFELSKQAIEVSQKKLDTVRAYAEKRFNVGNAEFDKVYKEQFEAAKDVVKNKADAEKLAKENTLKMLQMENNLEVQRLQNKGSLAAASVRSEGNEGKRQVDALKAELASIDKELAPLLKTPFGPNKAKIAALEAQKAQVQKDLRAAGGVSTMGAAPGAPKGPGGTNQQNWSIKPLQ